VPNSGVGAPRYVWRDNGDLSFIADLAPIPNRAAGFNNAGLPADFHPVTMLREASSSSSSADLSMVRTTTVGDVVLDGSPSVMPLIALSAEHVSTFHWTQTSGPFVAVAPHNDGVVTIHPTVAATYTFTLTVTNSLGFTDPPFNPYTNADGSLSRDLVLTVLPGAQGRTVVLLPGQSLAPGTVSSNEVVAGTAKVATEGSAYVVRVVTTDDFFNEVPAPPGAQVRLVTSDPDDVDPPFQSFIGSTSTFTVTPSHTATTLTPDIDDVAIGAFEHGDIGRPYVVGRTWHASALVRDGTVLSSLVRFTWDPDPRAVRWSIYRQNLAAGLRDVDGDGLPDLGYGECAPDPDPTDNYFEDATMPPPGGGFMYAGTESLVADGVVQEAGLGRTSAGLERPNLTPCP
jgi:hypothetical protein